MNKVANKVSHQFSVLAVDDDSEMRELLVTELLIKVMKLPRPWMEKCYG